MLSNNQYKLLFVITFLCSIYLSCTDHHFSEQISRNQLPGIYCANYNAGIADTLILHSDSTYIRIFVDSNSAYYSDSGVWYYQIAKYDSKHVSIFIPDFKNRFSVDPLKPFTYSNSEYAILDTLPHPWLTFFCKEGDKMQIIREPLGDQAYVRIIDGIK